MVLAQQVQSTQLKTTDSLIYKLVQQFNLSTLADLENNGKNCIWV